MAWFMAEQKCVIVVAATLVFLMGLFTFSGSIKALNSDSFEETAEMAAEFSHGDMDLRKQLKANIAFAVFTMIVAVLGCCGACRENKCMLCLYAVFAIKFGLAFCIIGTMAITVMEVQSPTLIRSSNRICANQAHLEAADLKCTNATAQAALQGIDSALAANMNQPAATGTAATSRRLANFMQQDDSSTDLWAGWFGPDSPGRNAAFVYAQMLGQQKEEQMDHEQGRQLKAGTTEKQPVLKMGGTNPCAFVERLCIAPDGFNPVTACICEGSLQTPGVAGNIPKASPGAFCKNWGPPPALATATGTPIPAGEAWCYVTVGSECDSKYSNVGPYPPVAGGTTSLMASSAPCVGQPDFRSKMVKEGVGMVNFVIHFILGTGGLLMLSVIFACCLCCEIHTGKNAMEHGKDFAQVSDSDSD